MRVNTKACGVILWIEDAFENIDLEETKREPWPRIFGRHSDRIFRLMDLSLEFATSFSEAMHVIKSYERLLEAGVFLYCVLDLMVPRQKGSSPSIKYGVLIAQELKKRGIPFVFYSTSTNAFGMLEQAGLAAVPYYVKEPGYGRLTFPESLSLALLSDIKNQISWVSLKIILDAVHPESDIIRNLTPSMPAQNTDVEADELPLAAFHYYPFFGPFREYVERCEYRLMSELPKVFSIRAQRFDCDEFIQQGLAILLYQNIMQKHSRIRILYGNANEKGYPSRLEEESLRGNPDVISIIRISGEEIENGLLNGLLNKAIDRTGNTILVFPNDESYDRFSTTLQEHRIVTLEELPQIRPDDSATREEMIRQACALMFQQWTLRPQADDDIAFPGSYLAHPELLINPICWTVLMESGKVVEELSDPFEILKELYNSLNAISPEQRRHTRTAISKELPIPYQDLLNVGQATSSKSKYGKEMSKWIEMALDMWLSTSWNFPYGLKDEFSRLNLQPHGGELTKAHAVKWQDACYEMLVSILEYYKSHKQFEKEITPAQADLEKIGRFIEALGGHRFLESNTDHVKWDALEVLRWPHLRYPIPSAITRRLKQAKKFFWIQPDGLDLAASLPSGRARYRVLVEIVEQYWSVLTWGKEIAENLPCGWRESVSYLTDLILDHNLPSVYSDIKKRRDFWDALLCLVRNGGPIMLISDSLILGKKLTGDGKTTEKYLSSVQGYGKIVNWLRGHRAQRVGSYLIPKWGATKYGPQSHRLKQIVQYLSALQNQFWKDKKTRLAETEETIGCLLGMVAGSGNLSAAVNEEENTPILTQALTRFFRDSDLLSKEIGLPNACSLPEWGDGDGRESIPSSMFQTKADLLWQTLDALIYLDQATLRYRYYDGYHLLAAINDLRVAYKDRTPMNLALIERVLDLFVVSIEGLIAQLAWCVKMAGEEALAESITPETVSIVPPDSFEPPDSSQLSSVLQIMRTNGDWSVYTLGIPGKYVNRLSYHSNGEVIPLDRQ